MTVDPVGGSPPPNLLPAALELAALGFRVFPILPRDKRAYLQAWQTQATSDPDQLTQLWAQAPPGANLALLMGATIATPQGPAIVVALDVDERSAFSGTDTLHALEQDHGRLPERTARQLTGSGGGSHHLLLLLPADTALRGGDLGPGVTLKAHHGYIVGPGSTHPDTGLVYDWEDGYEPQTVGVEWMPARWLAMALARQERRQRAADVESRPVPEGRREHPGDWLPDWPELLVELGATPAGTKVVDGEAYPAWLRPSGGNPPTSEFSAVVLDHGLWVYTDAWPCADGRSFVAPSEATGSTYSRFGFYTAVTQGSTDQAAMGRAAAALRARYGLPDKPQPSLLHPSLGARAGLPRQQWGEAETFSLDPDSADDGSSWDPVDLSALLAGEVVSPVPTLLARTDGVALFYRGAVNGIHGESGIGKSWLAFVAALAELLAGRVVMILDYEDTAITLITRLRALGVTDDVIRAQVIYLRPQETASPAVVDRLVALIAERVVALVLIDSVGEALAVEGRNEDKDNEVSPWVREVPRRLADAGPAVLLVDHGTKAADAPLHPSGSKRKRAAITGSSFLVRPDDDSPLAKSTDGEPVEGRLFVVTAKDRHGTHPRGQLAATLTLTAQPDGTVEVTLWAPAPERAPDPDYVMVISCAQAAVNACRDEGAPLSQNALEGLIRVKAQVTTKRSGVALAVDRGALRLDLGPNRSKLYSYVSDLPMAVGDHDE